MTGPQGPKGEPGLTGSKGSTGQVSTDFALYFEFSFYSF